MTPLEEGKGFSSCRSEVRRRDGLPGTRHSDQHQQQGQQHSRHTAALDVAGNLGFLNIGDGSETNISDPDLFLSA